MRRITVEAARRRGQQDAMYGLSLSDNPWTVFDLRHAAWNEGWHEPRDWHKRVYADEDPSTLEGSI